MPTSVSKSLVLFASLPGQIMISIVIHDQFVHLVAPFTDFHLVRKKSKLQQEGYLLKTILLSSLFRAL